MYTHRRVSEIAKLRTNKGGSSQFYMQRCRKQYKTDKSNRKELDDFDPLQLQLRILRSNCYPAKDHCITLSTLQTKLTPHNMVTGFDEFNTLNSQFPDRKHRFNRGFTDNFRLPGIEAQSDKATTAVTAGTVWLVGSCSPLWRGIGTRRRTRRGTSGHRRGRGGRARAPEGGRRTRRCARGPG